MTSILYAPNSITLGSLVMGGAVDANGVVFWAEQMQGWGSPKGTLTVTQKPRSHGGWRSESYLTSRVIAINGVIQAPSPTLLAQARHQLDAAVSLSDTTFSVTEYGETLYSTVTRQDEVLYGDETETWTTFSIQLVAEDPRRYGPTTTKSTNMPSQSGGLTFSTTFPITFPATVVPGTVSFFNPGNVAAPVILTIHGPCVGPIVTHVSTGAQLVFSSSLTLASGEFLVVDMDARTVKAGGQSSRIGYVTSRGWFALDPGSNDIGFNASVYNSSATLDVTGPQGAWL